MSNRNFFRAGSHYFICDVCGQKYHAEEKRRRWDNLIVCPDDFELRHPQDFLRTREDRQAVPNPRPRPADVFIVRNPLTDHVHLYDGEDQTYIQEGYFAEDYILGNFYITVQYSRSISDSVISIDNITISNTKAISDSVSITDNNILSTTKNITDNISTSDTGMVVLLDYVDTSYFADIYVGTISSF